MSELAAFGLVVVVGIGALTLAGGAVAMLWALAEATGVLA
jgi:hypothetical protein